MPGELCVLLVTLVVQQASVELHSEKKTKKKQKKKKKKKTINKINSFASFNFSILELCQGTK